MCWNVMIDSWDPPMIGRDLIPQLNPSIARLRLPKWQRLYPQYFLEEVETCGPSIHAIYGLYGKYKATLSSQLA